MSNATASWKDELISIANRNQGILRPEDVVAFAKDTSTALHGRFTWDDTEAAQRYRLDQARDLIQVVVTVIPGTKRTYRAFVSLNEDRANRGGGYRYVVDVLNDAGRRKNLLAEALAEFDRWSEKYESLKEIVEIVKVRRKLG